MSDPDKSEDMLEADLGLGDGLKPGTLTKDATDPKLLREEMERCISACISDSHNSGQSNSDDSEEEVMTLLPIGSIQDLKSQYSYLIPRSNRSTEVLPSLKDDYYFYDGRYLQSKPGCTSSTNCTCKQPSPAKCSCKQKSCDICAHSNLPEFPVYADVPYGTSIRQQKELFNHNLEEIKKKKNVSVKQDSQSFNGGMGHLRCFLNSPRNVIMTICLSPIFYCNRQNI